MEGSVAVSWLIVVVIYLISSGDAFPAVASRIQCARKGSLCAAAFTCETSCGVTFENGVEDEAEEGVGAIPPYACSWGAGVGSVARATGGGST